MTAVYLGHFKDTYTGTGTGPSITFNFHSPHALSSSMHNLGLSGSNYVMQYHVNGNLFNSTAYSCTFSLIQGYKWNPAAASTIVPIGSVRDLTYDPSVYISGVSMGVYSTNPGFPQITITTSSGMTWGYSVFVDEYLTLFDGV